MKKIFVLIMCMLCLAGCSEGSSTGDATNSKEELSKKYCIGDEIDLAGVDQGARSK